MEQDQERFFTIAQGLCCFEGTKKGAKEKGAVDM